MPQAQTMAVPKRWPLVIDPQNRDSSVSKDARLVNCYMEKAGEDVQIYRRPGLLAASQPSGGAATGRGVYNWRDNIYSIFGNTVYKDGVALAGTVDTTNGVYRFDSCLGVTPKLQLGNGVKGYNYDSGAGLVQITDVDFPASFVKGWAYLDGTSYVMLATSYVQGSAINDPTSWDPLNVILAQIEPDRGRALGKQLTYVIAMKEWSTEVFYDAGNAVGSPLGNVQSAKLNYGCQSADSVQNIDGSLFWIATNREAAPQAFMMTSLKAQAISTPAVDRILAAGDYSTVFSWSVKVNGHNFYVVTLKNSNITLAYDISTGMWSQWTDASGNYLPIVSSTYDSSNRHIVQHESNGYLYYMSDAYYNDANSLIQLDIYTPNWDGGVQGRGKMLSRMEFIGDQVPGSTLQVRSNSADYDSKSWTNFRNVDLSQKRPYLLDEGTFNRRAYNFRHRCNTAFRLRAVELQIDLGTL